MHIGNINQLAIVVEAKETRPKVRQIITDFIMVALSLHPIIVIHNPNLLTAE